MKGQGVGHCGDSRAGLGRGLKLCLHFWVNRSIIQLFGISALNVLKLVTKMKSGPKTYQIVQIRLDYTFVRSFRT